MVINETADVAIPELAGVQRRAFAVGAVAALVSAIGLFVNVDQFLQSYLMAFMWCLGVTLGCLALGMVHQLSGGAWGVVRSEEHTSELQSQSNLVCRLLLEKKKKTPVFCRFRPVLILCTAARSSGTETLPQTNTCATSVDIVSFLSAVAIFLSDPELDYFVH